MTYFSSKIIRSKELVAHLGIGRFTLYDWINPKSSRFDPTFPKNQDGEHGMVRRRHKNLVKQSQIETSYNQLI